MRLMMSQMRLKRKQIDYKQFELFGKADKRSKLDGRTKNFLRRLKIEKKVLIKRDLGNILATNHSALVNKLLSQNTQDLRKSLNKIKQQKIELNKDERNSTNNENENDRLNMILSVIDRIYQFFEYKFLPGEQPDELKLPKWVKVSEKDSL